MKPLVSLHLVHYSCPNCGEEMEEVKMCKECNAPMRVIKTVELYGDEANEYLDSLMEEKKKQKAEKDDSGIQFDDSVIGAETDELEEKESLVEESSGFELGEIYPDSDDEDDSGKKYAVDDLGADFEEALGFLDQDDDEIPDEMKGLSEL